VAEEVKVAPKFKVNFLGDIFLADNLLDELKNWCNEFTRLGLMPQYPGGAFGNLSFRCAAQADAFIITASGMKDFTLPESFVKVDKIDLQQQVVYCHGLRPPSSESILHYLIYKNFAAVNAVFHGHYAKILENAGKLNVPCTKKEEPYGTLALAKQALETLTSVWPGNFLVIKNHGFLAVGQDMRTAGESAVQVLTQT